MLTKHSIVHLPTSKATTVITSSQTQPLSSTLSSATTLSMASSKATLPSTPSEQYHSRNNRHGGTNAEKHQMHHSHTARSSCEVSLSGQHYLVSDTLYFQVPLSIQDGDILKLLASCRPLLIQRNDYQEHVATGSIRFVNKEQADRAYTLFDGLVLRNSHRFQLYITPHGNKDPVPNAPIFQINHLPSSITNEGLYSIFRPFGPIRLCKIIMEKDASFNGTALLQYFDQRHAEGAKNIMDGKCLEGGKGKHISIFSLVSNKLSHQSNPSPTVSSQKPPMNLELNPAVVDYTNLYIKNLDLAAKSADLYNAFRGFGHIISARVMKNPRTKQSRGYGFVSFTRPDDAQAALDQFNGCYILGKPVVIAYHEPKRHTNSVIPSPISPTSYQKPPMTGEPSPSPLGNNFTISSQIDQRYYQAFHAAATELTTLSPTRLKTHIAPQAPKSSSLPLLVSSSLSSSSTSSVTKSGPHGYTDRPQSQRGRVRAAILKVISNPDDKDMDQLDHWVDHVMSLRSTTRALCLFNPAYLVARLDDPALMKKTTSPVTPKTPNLIQPTDHLSHASSSTTASSSAVVTTTDLGDQQRYYSVALFVESIKGLSLLQQKQHLGDLLFPRVKATGTKQASKVTIHLLDTQPLEHLAFSMHSIHLLKPLVDKAFITLTRQQSFIKAVIQK
ncbi:hypothetical protein [Absidia glauca]|uniref:Uncharacterized protein n=1 Tax=Absidia glauca TaxID=4829 RepID=A0A163KH44_ABSGL|nr:hypothetical protein [Absidia glauca]